MASNHPSFVHFREILIIDMDKSIELKLQNLEKTKAILKTEFIGIDHIIDQLIQSITPWYVTPEVLNRPQIISLWGITGTGKTSILKRLFQILEISKVVCIDSGEINDKLSLSDLVSDTFSLEDSYSTSTCGDAVFIFDEFQHARTIDDSGKEITKPSTRQMWNLIDNGQLVLRSNDYTLTRLITFLEDLEGLVAERPDIKLKNLIAENPDDVKGILDVLGLVWFEERAGYLLNKGTKLRKGGHKYGKIVDEEEENEMNPFRPLFILPSYIIQSYFTLYTRLDKTINNKERIDRLLGCTTISEVYQVINEITTRVGGQKTLDFSKSLVLLVGNLDEAFYLSKNVDPDLNADVFKKIIDKKVTIHSIKSALKSRFRAEQIARFGNTILKYPAFSSEEFKRLIRLELDRVLGRFLNTSKRRITYTDDIVDLIYSEGVYPAQGARPILTTISSMFTPLLSSVLINFPEGDELIVSTLRPEEGFRKNNKTLIFKSKDSDKILEITIDLTVGATRNPDNNPYRYIFGVHEAGHAVAYAWAFGELPLDIVSTSAKGGGHTSFDSTVLATITREYIKRNLIMSVSGHSAETIFYKPDTYNNIDRVTTGASQDFDEAFNLLREAVYNGGYFLPKKYANICATTNDAGMLVGFDDKEIEQLMEKEFNDILEISRNIIRTNITLVAAIAKHVAEFGNMTPEQFKNMIEQVNGKNLSKDPLKLTIELIDQRKQELSFDNYKNVVLDILGENN